MIVDGDAIGVTGEQTVAGALYAAGIHTWRTTRFQQRPRGIFCGIGACYDCLVTIDGVANQRACVTPAGPDTIVTTATGLTGRAPKRAATAGARYDLAVVGAGPAGLAAAATAALG